MNIDTQYDTILKIELEKRLKRTAKSNELTNADNDSDLVNEVFWQLIIMLSERIKILESKLSIK